MHFILKNGRIMLHALMRQNLLWLTETFISC